MAFDRVLFSSARDDWRTPESFYKALNREFRFNFDPYPVRPSFDGLKIEWKSRSFVNPPYSDWGSWVVKALEESRKGKLAVLLLAARTDTLVFHDVILPYAKEIRFIKGRLKFGGAKNSAPFPSMIIIFDGRLNHGSKNR